MADKTQLWHEAQRWAEVARSADSADVRAALTASDPSLKDLAALLSDTAHQHLEAMATRAQALTRRHFGRTVSLYAPLYLSNYCGGGCAYCGFASDRQQTRHRLSEEQLVAEIEAMKAMGLDEILLLTGERTSQAGFDYLLGCVERAAQHVHQVSVESFAMTAEEYRKLAAAGCTGVTLYQETYDPDMYQAMHRWGPKRDYDYRLDSPARALKGGIRTVGVGALLGLADPVTEAIALYLHARALKKTFWQNGIAVSFPRIQPEAGGFSPPHPVSENLLAQMVFAFRLCLPDVPLVLSTRERPRFRDGMAGVGISKMSVASRTTVGGYDQGDAEDEGQFEISDPRGVDEFRSMLAAKGLSPVFKNWESVYRAVSD